jgi:hypothetical protein
MIFHLTFRNLSYILIPCVLGIEIAFVPSRGSRVIAWKYLCDGHTHRDCFLKHCKAIVCFVNLIVILVSQLLCI